MRKMLVGSTFFKLIQVGISYLGASLNCEYQFKRPKVLKNVAYVVKF